MHFSYPSAVRILLGEVDLEPVRPAVVRRV